MKKKKLNHRLGMEKYNMREYWDKRAEYVNEDEFKAICVFGASREFNEYLNELQARLFSKLLNRIGDLKNKKVLEIGRGIGRWAKYLMEREPTIHYTGIDISPKMVEIAKRRLPLAEFLNMPGDNLSIEDESFDLVFSITVLQHIPYEKQIEAIKEMCRIVKRGSYIIIIEDVKQPENSFNMFTRSISGWRALFENNGCYTLYVVKHKCILPIPIPINNKILMIFRILLERLVTYILPEKYFSGIGILFKKVS